MPATKGHWPKGRRRSTIAPNVWGALRARVALLLDEYPLWNVRSRRAIARALDVDVRTVCRWLNGDDHPEPDHMARLRLWYRDQRRYIQRMRARS